MKGFFSKIVLYLTCSVLLSCSGRPYIYSSLSGNFVPDDLIDIVNKRKSKLNIQYHDEFRDYYVKSYREFIILGSNNRKFYDQVGNERDIRFQILKQAYYSALVDAENNLKKLEPSDFGYIKTRVIGSFVYEFEGTRFVPLGVYSKDWRKAWYFRLREQLVRSQIIEGVLYEVEGFLSPYGRYGHMGIYNLEIIVDNIRRL